MVSEKIYTLVSKFIGCNKAICKLSFEQCMAPYLLGSSTCCACMYKADTHRRGDLVQGFICSMGSCRCGGGAWGSTRVRRTLELPPQLQPERLLLVSRWDVHIILHTTSKKVLEITLLVEPTHFSGEETAAQRGQLTCPRLHS